MESQTLRALLIGTVSGLAGYYTFQQTGIFSSMVVLFTVAWLIYRFSEPGRAWKTLGNLMNPFIATMVSFLGGFSYSAVQGGPAMASLQIGLTAAFFGAVLSMLTYKYWNIGP